MSDPYAVVRDFEAALCEYAGARYAVTTTSCTTALLLAVAWHAQMRSRPAVSIPRFTYVGVAMSIVHAGGWPSFRKDDAWVGEYQLAPFPVWDAARWLRAGMHRPGTMACVSFHHTKHLGLAAHGGAILHDDPAADAWLRRARFDGRAEGVAPTEDDFPILGWHAYMTPPTAAEGLLRLASLPRDNAPLPWSGYADLSKLKVFR